MDSKYNEGDILVTTETCNHGDLKTRVARPDDYPALPKGTPCTFIKKWKNFYGIWIRVRVQVHPQYDQTYDLRPEQVELQKPTVE